MRIVGFAQVMRLGVTAEEGYVLTIQLDNGTEVTIPTSQDTVLALTKLWAENRAIHKAHPKVLVPKATESPAVFMPPPPIDESVEDADEGEVFGGHLGDPVVADEMGYPIPVAKKVPITDALPPMPRPKFLETDDDDDGQQV